MAETLMVFQSLISGPDGVTYEPRACGAPMADGMWQGWIEFVPVGGGAPVRSPRETTQPNRSDAVYWATGLTAVYLEGALRRAVGEAPHVAPPASSQPAVFSEPAPSVMPPLTVGRDSVMDPFSVYQKGEALLRKQLSALSSWHLVNIILDFELSDLAVEALNEMPAVELVELIVAAVRAESNVADSTPARRR